MATLATYPIYYFLGGSSTTPDSYLSTYAYDPDTGPTTLEDDHDGIDDGLISVGDQLSWSRDTLGSGAKITTLYGFAANGDPIIEVYNASFGSYNYYQLSSDPNLKDSALSITRSGTYQMCFLAGTEITVPGGEVSVETLRIGDCIVTTDGRAVPVRWIGRQTVSTRFGPAERLMPVRFAAGSLGNGVPSADLTVTADHGVLVEGVICHAGALVNGETITRVPLAEIGATYTVYHIETEEHEIILANGAPAETFIDNVSRRVFDNYAEFEALYGDVPEMAELPYPRAMSARQVPEGIRAKLAPSKAA
ncbi:Hint domain-containing protein [Nioella aestuarii]|uniref:Hint domain-containing protein n=1 Tax=Nioella aestuarii TaxID=1662864 RepID=UPI003D7FC9DC